MGGGHLERLHRNIVWCILVVPVVLTAAVVCDPETGMIRTETGNMLRIKRPCVHRTRVIFPTQPGPISDKRFVFTFIKFADFHRDHHNHRKFKQ